MDSPALPSPGDPQAPRTSGFPAPTSGSSTKFVLSSPSPELGPRDGWWLVRRGRGASRLPSFRQPPHLTPNRHLTCPQSKHGFQKPAGNVLLPKTGAYPPGREEGGQQGPNMGQPLGANQGPQVREQSQGRPMGMLRGTPESATTAPRYSGLDWEFWNKECMRSGVLRRTPVSRGPAGPGAGGLGGLSPDPEE